MLVKVPSVSAQAAADPDYRLDGEDLFAWEADHGLVPEGAVLGAHADPGGDAIAQTDDLQRAPVPGAGGRARLSSRRRASQWS